MVAAMMVSSPYRFLPIFFHGGDIQRTLSTFFAGVVSACRSEKKHNPRMVSCMYRHHHIGRHHYIIIIIYYLLLYTIYTTSIIKKKDFIILLLGTILLYYLLFIHHHQHITVVYINYSNYD